MPKAKKVIAEAEEVKPIPAEEPVQESPAQAPAVESIVEPSVDESKKFGTLGLKKVIISSISKKVINGIEYNEVSTLDGLTTLLSDKDLESQRNV